MMTMMARFDTGIAFMYVSQLLRHVVVAIPETGGVVSDTFILGYRAFRLRHGSGSLNPNMMDQRIWMSIVSMQYRDETMVLTFYDLTVQQKFISVFVWIFKILWLFIMIRIASVNYQ